MSSPLHAAATKSIRIVISCANKRYLFRVSSEGYVSVEVMHLSPKCCRFTDKATPVPRPFVSMSRYQSVNCVPITFDTQLHEKIFYIFLSGCGVVIQHERLCIPLCIPCLLIPLKVYIKQIVMKAIQILPSKDKNLVYLFNP